VLDFVNETELAGITEGTEGTEHDQHGGTEIRRRMKLLSVDRRPAAGAVADRWIAKTNRE
jgi:hypothetical protein